MVYFERATALNSEDWIYFIRQLVKEAKSAVEEGEVEDVAHFLEIEFQNLMSRENADMLIVYDERRLKYFMIDNADDFVDRIRERVRF